MALNTYCIQWNYNKSPSCACTVQSNNNHYQVIHTQPATDDFTSQCHEPLTDCSILHCHSLYFTCREIEQNAEIQLPHFFYTTLITFQMNVQCPKVHMNVAITLSLINALKTFMRPSSDISSAEPITGAVIFQTSTSNNLSQFPCTTIPLFFLYKM